MGGVLIVPDTLPSAAHGQQLDQATRSADVSPLEDQSLTSLIGQLLKLEAGENVRNHATDDATSTHVSEDEASEDSHDERLSSLPSMYEEDSANEFSVKAGHVQPDLCIPSSRKISLR